MFKLLNLQISFNDETSKMEVKDNYLSQSAHLFFKGQA